jgi:hypothetical protein
VKEIEVLLLETSGHFANTDRPKVSFDHHKGLFGALSMLKYIADEYTHGKLETACCRYDNTIDYFFISLKI